ncbi:MAG: tRNA (adenosine(37)-N6)-dimethylallyltransferase MiaA [Fusobacteriaceae bacterium]
MLKAIVIGGPTGVGKTSLSIKLAKRLNGEIISGDSAQVFKGLNIGTAKISINEMMGVPHHLIDILEPIEKYSVGQFQKDADLILESLEKRGKTPILVGGTGLYLRSVTDGLSYLPPADKDLRERFKEFSTEEIFEKLKSLDLVASQAIHPNNRVKIERALEVCILSREKFSVLSLKNIKNNNFDFLKISLERDRDFLYSRINIRVDSMIKEGLVEEVSSLFQKYGDKLKTLNIIGYAEIIKFLEGTCTLEESIENIKQNSRHYAKRQFTWFRGDSSYVWYNLDLMSEEEIIENILKNI